jgi:hypothetical protein
MTYEGYMRRRSREEDDRQMKWDNRFMELKLKSTG